MRRDMMKTMSYAVVHFTVAFSVVYLMTGSIPIATGVALIEPLINTIAYFFHERAWSVLERRPEKVLAGDRRTPDWAEGSA